MVVIDERVGRFGVHVVGRSDLALLVLGNSRGIECGSRLLGSRCVSVTSYKTYASEASLSVR
jgi:hypothetical protein